MTSRRPDLGRITLSVLAIGGLIGGSLWILAPFLGAFIWAAMIVVATWPMMRRVESMFGGRRTPAVAVMSLGLLAVLLVPIGVALQAILSHTDEMIALLERVPEMQLPAAPDWLGRIAGRGRTCPGGLEPTGRRGLRRSSWCRHSRTFVPSGRGSRSKPAVSRCYSCSSC